MEEKSGDLAENQELEKLMYKLTVAIFLFILFCNLFNEL